MFEWTDRLQAPGDWITFVLFMVFVLLAFLSQRHYLQFRLFVDIRNLKNYRLDNPISFYVIKY